MYGLPSDFDVSAFIGIELVQISFSANTIHLVFEPDVQVTIESSFVVQAGPDLPPLKDSPPLKSSNMMTLISQRVRSASSSAIDGSLTLHFEGGGFILFIDDSENYESYKIVIQGKEIIV